MFTRDPRKARIGEEILPLEMGYLPEFFQKKAEIELNDTPEMRKKNIKEIKQLIKDDPNLSDVHYGDDSLLLFLLTRKHDVLRAFKQLKAFTSFKKRYREIFTNPDLDMIQIGIKQKILTILPWRCQDGCAIIRVSIENWEPSSFPVEEVKKYYIVFFAQALLDPMTQVNGFKAIVEMNVNPLKQLRFYTPQNLYMLCIGFQECIPGRFKEIHCINVSTAGRILWFLVRPFLSEKIKNRIFFHSKIEELPEFFPAAIIPRVDGGELEDFDSTEWMKRFVQPDKWKHSDFIEITGEN